MELNGQNGGLVIIHSSAVADSRQIECKAVVEWVDEACVLESQLAIPSQFQKASEYSTRVGAKDSAT